MLAVGAQPPAEGNAFAFGVVERAYAGLPDKTAGRGAAYDALKRRLRSDIAAGRGIDRDGIARGVRIPLPLSDTLLDNADIGKRRAAR